MNRWYFWVLAPVMLGTAIGLPFWTEPPTVSGRVVLWVLCGALVLATVGLANPLRFAWAFRPVAAVILLGYVSYVVVELLEWKAGKPFGLGGRRSDTNLFNALCGFVVFGVPSLVFLFTGRSGRAIDVLVTGRESQGNIANPGRRSNEHEVAE